MLNEEEVKYNVASLVSTWFSDIKDVPDLILILTNDKVEATIECPNLDEVISQLSSALIDNAEKYIKATLIGVVGEKDVVFGELDIF